MEKEGGIQFFKIKDEKGDVKVLYLHERKSGDAGWE